MLNISHCTVGRIIQRQQEMGLTAVIRRGRYGRHRSPSIQTVRVLARAAIRNPRATARQIQAEVGGPALETHRLTIQRSLIRSGLAAYRPVAAPAVTGPRMATRLNWARQHINWTVDNWRSVVFSDETSIEVSSVSSHFVRRRRGAPLRAEHVHNPRQFSVKVMS